MGCNVHPFSLVIYIKVAFTKRKVLVQGIKISFTEQGLSNAITAAWNILVDSMIIIQNVAISNLGIYFFLFENLNLLEHDTSTWIYCIPGNIIANLAWQGSSSTLKLRSRAFRWYMTCLYKANIGMLYTVAKLLSSAVQWRYFIPHAIILKAMIRYI